ncbi:MAG TPA: SdrD B-like domain-containing protein, partial [Cellulomonas sp.]
TGAGTPPAAVAADGTVRWTVTIENTGAATVTGIDLTDTLAGMSGWTITWPGTDGRLAPGQQAVATATSALTQAQVDAGVVTSVATATGQASDASEVRATATTPVTFTVPGAVTVRLEADGTHVTTAPGTPVTDGDDIAWTYTVTNTGAATLHGVTVSDDRVPATTITAPAGFTGDLAPGESVVLTATSVATFGEHPVTATVQATAGDGTATVADTDTVWYAATAAERGSVTGHVRIDTARDGLTSTAGTPATGVGVRLVDTATDDVLRTVTDAQGTYGFSGLAAGTYRVEVEQGTVTGDIVTVTVDPDGVLDGVTEVTLGGRQTVADLDFAVAVRNPALTLTVSPQASSGALAAGDQVTFTYTLTNSGDTPLTGITVPDSLDPARVSTTATWPADEGVLAAGEQATITVTYTLDQADVDAGLVTTRAHGEATDDLGTEVTSATVTAQVIVPSGAALTVTGTGALPEQIAAGEQVDWTMTIANTGATTVSAIEVTDALAGMSDYVVTWPGTPGVLAPGEEAVASATSTLTQEQVDAGTAVASVTATGSAAPDGVEVSTSVQVPVRFNVPGQVRIEVELNGSRWSEAPGLEVLDGAELVWTYRVTNIGAVTLHDVAVSDDRASGSMIQAPEGFTGDLAPGESVVLTASSVATVGVWPVSARVEAIEGTVGTQIVAADVAWYTATAVAIDPAAPAGGGGTGGSGTSSEVSASGAGATGAGTTTSQVLAVTGASVLGLAALALLVTLVGAGLVRARTLREAAER